MIVDAHLDLAMNAIEWNRDLTRPIDEIRAREQGLTDKPDRGNATVSFDEMRRGGVGLCVATQIARYVAPGNPLPGWHSQEQAWAMTQAQLAWYRAMEERGELTQIRDRETLERHLAKIETVGRASPAPTSHNVGRASPAPTSHDVGRASPAPASHDVGRASPAPTSHDVGAGLARPPVFDGPIGYILSLEGADSLVSLAYLERAYEQGLRAVGPAHYGPGVYAHGTSTTGDLGARGRELLREMDRLGMILDVTHLSDESFREALDRYQGSIWASHSNCRALVPHQRQLPDGYIRALVDRGAVIGAALDAWMLVPGWKRGESTPQAAGVTLEAVADHIDHVCQIAGNARHCAIGSDLDGAFGREQCPADLQTIADLPRLLDVLARRGFTAADVEAIASGNFLRVLRAAWE